MADGEVRSAEWLLARAREAAETAYVPYSSFPVGAALVTADGTVITGANVENASYGLTVCAERNAVFAAVLAGHREITTLAVVAPRTVRASPCGACRQVLNEFLPVGGDMTVYLEAEEGHIETTLTALLPMGFGPRDLD
ncbi:MAG TPA: cytidine deaminase [Thermomicrobiales bacterium]|nr:cytidine deaminase [Thermomicrobiales bacterium]